MLKSMREAEEYKIRNPLCIKCQDKLKKRRELEKKAGSQAFLIFMTWWFIFVATTIIFIKLVFF